MPALKPGYILHADPEWVRFHLANSIGGAVGYCRGPGAPFQNVERGGKLFFRDRSVTPKQIEFWADFDESVRVSIDEAWGRFGRELGAGSHEEWLELVARLPAIADNNELIVIRGTHATAPEFPVRLMDVGVVDIRGATKGWSIGQDDVNRLLANSPVHTAADIESPPPGRVEQIVSRIIRDTALVSRLKRLHNYECQLCGHTIALANGTRYCEGHHLQPLGGEHSGPDIANNVLCLCPNHHAACDLGAIKLDLSALRFVEGHPIDQRFIDYHNQIIFRG